MKVKYGKRKGLDGPFEYPTGHVLYFDPKEGKYWDPSSDFYVEDEEVNYFKQTLLDLIKGANHVR